MAEEDKPVENSLESEAQDVNVEIEEAVQVEAGGEENKPEAEADVGEGNTSVQGDQSDTTETSPSGSKSYRIPKLSERGESTEVANDDTQGNVEDDSHDIKVTVEEEQGSDTELLVDESMEVQSEINVTEAEQDSNEKAKEDDKADSSPKSKDEDKNENEEGKNRRHRSRSRNRSRSRSRSRSRDRHRHDRYQDVKDTSSDHPTMIRSRVFVGHLNTDRVTKTEVERLFSPYGKVIGVALNKGYGFVQYDNERSAKAAIREVHGTPFGGMKIVVDKTVALKKLLGEDPKSEPPLPRSPPRRRDRYDDDLDYYRRRDLHSRYSRLEELERYFYDRYERYPPPPPRGRDPYYDSYYDRPPPPSYMDNYDRSRYGDYERDRDRYMARERDRHPPPDLYYERRREDYYDDYSRGSDSYGSYARY